jgi:hypothetical protein
MSKFGCVSIAALAVIALAIGTANAAAQGTA